MGYEPLRRITSKLARSNRVPPPLSARHVEWSAIASLDDEPHRPTDRLLDLAMRSVEAASAFDLSGIAARAGSEDGTYVSTWPGEHYRLLAGMVSVLSPSLTVEVGTFRGLSALCMAEAGTEVVTFDVVPIDRIAGGLLRAEDQRIEQRVGDLVDERTWQQNLPTLRAAELIFLDGPKDGVFERKFLSRVQPLLRETGAVLVVDDIRVLPMVQVWRDVELPKLDLTSFGHWSGTGLVSAR